MKTVIALFAIATTIVCARDDAPPLGALGRMPVKEVTVFKDGHAFVSHEGLLPTDAAGNVQLDYLPAPVLGTFWPYAKTKNCTLTAVVAGQHPVTVARSPLNIREFIEANVGATTLITEDMTTYPAAIMAVAERSASELARTSPPTAGDLLPQKGDVVLLKTETGTRPVPFNRIEAVTFQEPPRTTWSNVEFRNLLTLKLDWGGRPPDRAATVGLMYVQRGIRWIPNYKVSIDGAGKATVKLQATLLNELTDLEDVTCHLVIGVPTFQFKDTPDPMALQGALAQLSQYFRESDPNAGQHRMLSNALMTQGARMSEYRAVQPPTPPTDLGPDVVGADAVEDLYLFTVKHVTLKKGQRMVVPVTEFTVPYRDVYTLALPFAPPPDVGRHFNVQQQGELARLLAAPKVLHKIRLVNQSDHPFTTAPALIVRDDRVLGQGLLTYTPKGGQSDLPVTAAMDIQIKKSETETKRTPNAVTRDGHNYSRVELAGTIALTSYRGKPVEVEVVRHVLGNITEASHGAKVEMVNLFEDSSFVPAHAGYPHWWNWWNWPHWWSHFNGVGQLTWNLKLGPGKTESLNYAWHYFWR